jgi:hypothetical protein
MTRRELGCITSPKQGNKIPPGATWCADNGKFGKGWVGRDQFLAWLTSLQPLASRCRFAVAPDVPFDMAATLAESASYLQPIRELGYPVALALQNGAENMELPWDDFDCAFIGGDTAWKLGLAAAALVRQAKELGKYVHLGRINGEGRWLYGAGIGADSADGTCTALFPDVYAPRVLAWQDRLRRRGAQGVLL